MERRTQGRVRNNTIQDAINLEDFLKISEEEDKIIK